MDEYTERTRCWLDERFSAADEIGVYRSHAPIYGFARDSMALGLYKNNYAVLKEIEALTCRLGVETVLEVGCAEGYTAHLVKEIFGLLVTVSDLSSGAVKRAGEIYGLPGFAGDVQCLAGVESGSFDLVLCSETIEHVPNPEKAFAELARVARKAVIVTVPAANSEAEKRGYLPPPGPHTHLNIFTRKNLEGYLPGCRVEKISNRWIDRFDSLFTGFVPAGPGKGLRFAARVYRRFAGLAAPLLGKFYGITAAKLFITADRLVCSLLPGSAHTYMAVLEKTRPGTGKARRRKADILEYMLGNSKVPPYKLPRPAEPE